MTERRGLIVFECPECNEEMEIPARNAGRYVTCVECGEEVRVPRRGVIDPDDNLSLTEHLMYGLLFLCVPGVNVGVSSILYYTWKADQPTRAKQINRLGFLTFGLHIVLGVGLVVLAEMLRR
jgi:hypothetical protein